MINFCFRYLEMTSKCGHKTLVCSTFPHGKRNNPLNYPFNDRQEKRPLNLHQMYADNVVVGQIVIKD